MAGLMTMQTRMDRTIRMLIIPVWAASKRILRRELLYTTFHLVVSVGSVILINLWTMQQATEAKLLV